MKVSLCLSVLGLSLLSACVEQTTDVPSEEDLKAARANILATAPTLKHPVSADIEGKVMVLGADVDVEAVTPGRPVTVTTYWKVVQPVTDGWRMFFHVNGTKRQFINFNHGPLKGKYPVSQWKAGEILRDVYTFTVPDKWDSTECMVYTGLWKGPLRMKVNSGPQDGENRVLVVKLPVKGGQAQAPRKRLIAKRTKSAPKIDGKLDDATWKEAVESDAFVATLNGSPVDQKTTVKALWDDKMLYLAFQNQDSDVWSELSKHDEKLWTQEVDEVMIDADGDGKTYIELQVNPTGATFDSYLPTYRQNQNDWESGLKAAVKVDGTLNKREDADKGWTAELALPLDAVKGRGELVGRTIPPKQGDAWRINFYRMDFPKGKPQSGTGWSAPLVGDFHKLDRFGELVFADEKGGVTAEGTGGEPAKKAEGASEAVKKAEGTGGKVGPKGSVRRARKSE